MTTRSLLALGLALASATALAQGQIGGSTPSLPVPGSDSTPGTGEATDNGSQDPAATARAGATIDFRSLDRDGDGALSRGEAGGNPDVLGRFGDLDSDRDGSLSTDEFRAFNEANRQGGIQTSFGSLDVNRDGRISRDEARGEARISARFSSLDSDRDGALSEREFSAFEALPTDRQSSGRNTDRNRPSRGNSNDSGNRDRGAGDSNEGGGR